VKKFNCLWLKLFLNLTVFKDLHVKQISIPMPWGEVKGQIFGNQSNSTPILCIHGHLDNSNSFKPLAELLCKSNEYHMIAIDMPGHGFSSPIPNGALYTPKLLLTVLRRIVLHLHLKNILFLGHSYGCGLCYLVFTFYPV